ncbi:cytochrome P450 [Dactylonectria estremocensis]|uniref:Cytochrome P450 n=1 Tax=Dactylonectria estremocensis TaxID=1079267 RepID=A0A9P9J2L0_9HYPO|nr:cytochrome P450 [Dactylonectria estremocensis]
MAVSTDARQGALKFRVTPDCEEPYRHVVVSLTSRAPPAMHPQAIYIEIAQKYNLNDIFYVDLWPVADPQVILTDPKLLGQVSIVKSIPIQPMAEDLVARIIGPNVIATTNGPLLEKLQKLHSTGVLMIKHLQLHSNDCRRIPYLDDFRDLNYLAESNTDFSLAFNPIVQAKFWFKRRRVNARLDASILSQIHEHRAHLMAEGKVPSETRQNSILNLMLREHIQNHQKETPGSAPSLLDTEETKILYIYSMLSKSPEVVDTLIQEHNTVFGSGFDATVEMLREAVELLQELPHTETVIKEKLRLFSIGFGAVVLNGHDLHYNASFFPNPTKFLPERWLDSDNTISGSYFRTFSRGSRAAGLSCLGMNLTQNELKIILLMTIRDYDFVYTDLNPNTIARTSFTNLDTLFGDVVFQELATEAQPQGRMMMKVQKR